VRKEERWEPSFAKYGLLVGKPFIKAQVEDRDVNPAVNTHTPSLSLRNFGPKFS